MIARSVTHLTADSGSGEWTLSMWVPHDRAASRHGVLTRDELRSSGLTDKQIRVRLKAGVLEEILPGVYRVGGVPTFFEQRVLAAQLWGGTDAVASHRSAGALWGLDRVPTGAVEISTSRNIKHPDVQVRRRWNIRGDDVSRKQGISLTNPTRTLLDLGSVLDLDDLEGALEDALRKGLTHIDLLLTRFDNWARRGRRGTTRWRRVLERRDPALKPTESDFETKLFQLCRRYGLPLPERQHEIHDAEGFAGRADFAYVSGLIAIEAESLRFHLSRVAFQRDLRRINRFQAAGWLVLRFSYLDLISRPEEVAREIRAALTLRRVIAA